MSKTKAFVVASTVAFIAAVTGVALATGIEMKNGSVLYQGRVLMGDFKPENCIVRGADEATFSVPCAK